MLIAGNFRLFAVLNMMLRKCEDKWFDDCYFCPGPPPYDCYIVQGPLRMLVILSRAPFVWLLYWPGPPLYDCYIVQGPLRMIVILVRAPSVWLLYCPGPPPYDCYTVQGPLRMIVILSRAPSVWLLNCPGPPPYDCYNVQGPLHGFTAQHQERPSGCGLGSACLCDTNITSPLLVIGHHKS